MKGEGSLSSPFFIISITFIFMNIVHSQIGIEQWFHPMKHNYFDRDSIDYISHIELSDNYHVGLVSYNDSLNIYENTKTFKLLKATKNTFYKFNIVRHKSVVQFLQPQYSLIIDNSYDEILFGLVHQQYNFKLDFEFLKFSSIDGISPFLSISYTPLPWLKILGGKRIKKPLSLKMNYLDFNFEVNDSYINFESYTYGINITNKTNKLKYLVENGKWEIPSSDAISTENGTKEYSELSGSFNFKNNQTLNWKYNTSFFSGGINFRNNSKLSFFKINNYVSENVNFLIEYNFIFSRIKIKTSVYLKEFNFYLSNRIRPTRIIPQLFENIFGLYLDNQNIGGLRSRTISFLLSPKQKRLFSPYMIFDWLVDSYNINLAMSIRQIIPYLEFSNNQDLSILGKKAINLGFGYDITYFKNWLIRASINQHIPYNISTKKRESNNSDSIDDLIDSIPDAKSIIDDFERTLTNRANYGGGLFQFTIRRYFD